jgi:hypothetical protein
MSAAFSAIIIVGAFVLPEGTLRMTEASTTRRFRIPFTLYEEENGDVTHVIICVLGRRFLRILGYNIA